MTKTELRATVEQISEKVYAEHHNDFMTKVNEIQNQKDVSNDEISAASMWALAEYIRDNTVDIITEVLSEKN